MFDKVGRFVERAAVGLSRRSFLTRIGRIGLGALTFATFVGEAAAAGTDRWILNGGCCGGQYPYLLQSKVRGSWVSIGCTQYGWGTAVLCAPSPRCCGGTGYCVVATCYSDGNRGHY
jgi:hypothetical protein